MTSIINNAFEAVKTAANHDEQVKALNALKVTELRELAKWQSIRLTGKTRKADIIAAIIELVHARQADTDEAKADEVAEQGNAKEAEAEVKSENKADCDCGGSCICVKIKPAPEIEAKLEACESFSEVINFVKENNITADEFHTLADKSMQGLERKGLYEMAVYYCEAYDLLLDTKKPYMARIDELFDELVPSSGAADSLAGELVRAVSRIGYRYYNDGDWLGIDGGRETCNPAARFLRKYGDKNIADIIKALWTDINERDYERHLSRLVFYVVNYIEANDNFKNLKTETIDDCRDPEQDFDDEENSYDAERCEYTYEFKPFEFADTKGGEPQSLAEQYDKLKAQYSDSLMLFKVGNVYKAYGHDAEITANKIDIALYAPTSDTPLLSAEIPAHAIDFYANALRKRGSEVIVFDKPLDCVFQEMKEVA